MEIYVSTDIETDGPIPGDNSMLSFASAAFNADGVMLGTFSSNLETLLGAAPHPETAEWWKTQPEAWAACRSNLEKPAAAMLRYSDWLNQLPGQPVFVAYPVGFDFLFIYWYLIKFTGCSPFKHAAIDIRSYAMAILKSDYSGSSKRNMPHHWVPPHTHTHVALDDAIEQGHLFMNMFAENGK